MTDQDLADDRKYRAPALEKGLDVLELLSAQGQAMTPSQMSVTLGRSVSELFRMIQVLEFRRYIEATPDGYRLTNRLFSLGMAQAPTKSLVEAALPVMRDLAARTVQSCHLVVPTEDQIVVIARIEGQVKASSVKKVAEFVDKHPDESTAILRSWVHEG